MMDLTATPAQVQNYAIAVRIAANQIASISNYYIINLFIINKL